MEGIPQFCTTDPVWYIHSEEEFERLMAECRRVGWREGIRRLEPEDKQRWIEGVRRSEGLFYTNIGPEKSVLEIGSGWGGMTISIARMCKEVHCVDNDPQGLRFIQLRAEQEGVRNIRLSRSYAHYLPYAEESFDLVVLSGVLEFVPSALSRLGPRQAQLEVLKACRKVLKKNGRLYLAIENRFAYHYLLGVRDEHTGLRWITPLPRRLGSIYHRIALRKPYRHWIYSYWSLRRLLRKADFEVPTVVSPYRSYRDIDYILELDSPSVLKRWFDEFMYRNNSIRPFARRTAFNCLKLAFVCGLHKTPLTKLFPICFFAVAERV